MPATLTSKEVQEVKMRFSRAFDELRYRGLVKTKKEFCENIGISGASNLLRIEDPDNNSMPTLYSIILLAKKYGISTEWLILGKGEFLAQK